MLLQFVREPAENITDLKVEIERSVEIPGSRHKLNVDLSHEETADAERATAINLRDWLVETLASGEGAVVEGALFKDLNSENSPWPDLAQTHLVFKLGMEVVSPNIPEEVRISRCGNNSEIIALEGLNFWPAEEHFASNYTFIRTMLFQGVFTAC